tara:strand:- start:684 stop:1565 length:882 start_codon:yes stop_codon:yes gene_type:complete
MNLNDLVPAPNAAKVNQLAKRVFGYALDLDNLSEEKAQRLHKNLSSQLNIYESKIGSASQTRTKYYEMKIALEALSKHIAEKKAKPDYIDIDGDGDKKESMKKAAKDKKEKADEGVAMVSTGGERDVTVMKTPDKSKRMTPRSKDKYAKPGKIKESVVTEGQVESSELIMAAKSMVDKYDAMIQDVGEMLNEDLAPVADKIRDEMGSDIADSFVAGMTGALQNTLDTMKADRVGADNATRVLVGDAPAEPMGMDMDNEIAADEMDMEPMDDEFAAADAAQGGEESPVGREKRA